MATEIERKFLVIGDPWRSLSKGKPYRQGYIPTQDHTTVRIRIAGDQGFLTIKSKTEGISRREYEYEIPFGDANEMLDNLCQKPLIEKIRYRIRIDNLIWEVDEFAGDNQGLIVAEVELETEDQAVILPDWIGEEVTGDNRYYNSNLAQFPYRLWSTN
ncbi:MAG: CYTH domain-containing protein [Microcystaceae cyanobacterium]